MANVSNKHLYQNKVMPIDAPKQFGRPMLGAGAELAEVDELVKAAEARHRFKVNGQGLAVAVLDTGCRSSHVDFVGRVAGERNFTADNNGNADDASDGNGHGTNVAGIIVADSDHLGIAPGASLVPVKVLRNNGGGSFRSIADGLEWVMATQNELSISAVCMSLGDGENYIDSSAFPGDRLHQLIRALKMQNVAVVVAAGNHYAKHCSRQGMAYPAIFKETISVGAVYDANEGSFSYPDGATAFMTAADRLTPFSQRLHESVSPDYYTDIFAPGAPVTSTGILNDHGESTQQGTSQATPVIAGVVLLLQSHYRRLKGELPEVDNLKTWMRSGGAVIYDGDDESDNVQHTGLSFRRVDAPKSLAAAHRHLQMQLVGPQTG